MFKKIWIYRHKRLSGVRVPRDLCLTSVSAAAGLPIRAIRRNDTQAKELRDAVPVRNRFDAAELAQFFFRVFYSRHGDDVGRNCFTTWPHEACLKRKFDRIWMASKKEMKFRMAFTILESNELFTRCEIIKKWPHGQQIVYMFKPDIFPCGHFQYLPPCKHNIHFHRTRILASNRYPYTPCHTAKISRCLITSNVVKDTVLSNRSNKTK